MTIVTEKVLQMTEPEAGPTSEPTRGQLLRAVMAGLFLDAGLSVAAYAIARLLGAPVFTALLAGTVAAALRVLWVVLRQRKIDPFAIFMMVIFGVGLLLSFWTGSPRFLLVKESFGTGVAGLAFVTTCLFGKPLAFHASARVAAATPDERAQWDDLWQTEPIFRRRFMIMSLVIGGALLFEALVRIPLVFVAPYDVMAVVSPFFTPVVVTATAWWSIHYGTGTEAAVEAANRPSAS